MHAAGTHITHQAQSVAHWTILSNTTAAMTDGVQNRASAFDVLGISVLVLMARPYPVLTGRRKTESRCDSAIGSSSAQVPHEARRRVGPWRSPSTSAASGQAAALPRPCRLREAWFPTEPSQARVLTDRLEIDRTRAFARRVKRA